MTDERKKLVEENHDLIYWYLHKNKLDIEEITSMVGFAAGNSSLKGIGMEYYAEYEYGGKMYRYNMRNIKKIDYIVKHYGLLETLYSKEFKEELAEIR